MKKICLLILLNLHFFYVNAQSISQRLYFDIDRKDKWELYTISKPGPYLITRPIHYSYSPLLSADSRDKLVKSFLIGFQVTDRFSVELSRYSENYFGGFVLTAPLFNWEDHHLVQTVENAKNTALRINFAAFNKKWIKLNSSIGYINSYSKFNNGGFFAFKSIDVSYTNDPATNQLTYLFMKLSEKRYVDFGTRPRFHSFDGRITLELRPFRWLGIYGGVGYTYGLNTFAHFNVEYWFDNGPHYTSSTDIKGTNYYTCFGLKVYPFRIFKKDKLHTSKNKIIPQQAPPIF